MAATIDNTKEYIKNYLEKKKNETIPKTITETQKKRGPKPKNKVAPLPKIEEHIEEKSEKIETKIEEKHNNENDNNVQLPIIPSDLASQIDSESDSFISDKEEPSLPSEESSESESLSEQSPEESSISEISEIPSELDSEPIEIQQEPPTDIESQSTEEQSQSSSISKTSSTKTPNSLPNTNMDSDTDNVSMSSTNNDTSTESEGETLNTKDSTLSGESSEYVNNNMDDSSISTATTEPLESDNMSVISEEANEDSSDESSEESSDESSEETKYQEPIQDDSSVSSKSTEIVFKPKIKKRRIVEIPVIEEKETIRLSPPPPKFDQSESPPPAPKLTRQHRVQNISEPNPVSSSSTSVQQVRPQTPQIQKENQNRPPSSSSNKDQNCPPTKKRTAASAAL